MPYPDDDDETSLKLTETTRGLYAAEHIYEGDDDFFSTHASAAYEYDDGRCDVYPLSCGEPKVF